MYEKLTKYLDEFTGTEFGTWIFDNKNDGTPEHPAQMPFLSYSSVIMHFIEDVHSFVYECEEIGLYNYKKVLEENGIEWGMESMAKTEVDNLDAKCVIALIFGVIRAERFCDGAILAFLKDGTIIRWLERLKTLDADGKNIAAK
ncbi:uncharacterized protein BN591_01635 [Catenibacterium sp. CAG:290]|uniref:DUF6508 domain-containing protein n=1 Tax=Catenibacterium sp. CAG:290 TaxID=1262767 RepID=UPI000335B2C1|nr:DUF6508 domain-containing protein [Catenibacterium sp. CAG:290]CDE27388.1 uncharacterized protein BN591_01635 [Catenibacterium sp. CAG:290]